MNRLRLSPGFTLLEILIVLTLLGIIVTFVGGKISDNFQRGKIEATRIQINILRDRLKEYERDCNNFPTTEQGLEALVQQPAGGACPKYAPGGYLEGNKVPQDPWGVDYGYQSDGKTFTIISYGKDGVEGGENFDADIDSSKL